MCKILLALQTVLNPADNLTWRGVDQSSLTGSEAERLRSSSWSVVEPVFRIRSEKGLPSPSSWKQSSLSIISLPQSVFIRCLIKI